ncbi:MAG TPA: hypothetical protein VNO34_06385 [Actinomycetota bacterium]|nr:hypothetical protein [Actinomycetota bacterium]
MVVVNCQFHDGLFVFPRSWPGDGLLGRSTSPTSRSNIRPTSDRTTSGSSR